MCAVCVWMDVWERDRHTHKVRHRVGNSYRDRELACLALAVSAEFHSYTQENLRKPKTNETDFNAANNNNEDFYATDLAFKANSVYVTMESKPTQQSQNKATSQHARTLTAE